MFSEGLFYAFSVLAVLGALGLVLFRHPMRGAMSLVVTMISLAGLYSLLSAKLIFVLQLIVYAGAIMSLIIFIIMFLNIQDNDLPVEEKRFAYTAGGIVVLIPVVYFLIKIAGTIPGVEATIVGSGFGGIKEVGLVLFQDWLLPFEIVSLLLLVTLVGAVVLAGKRRVGK
ncbi:NADH-quinone oxidoreductase subunit J family protein [Desulforhopalus singaporensis]|uniref:NADH-quinone oxidoreductase subunit J n=1 Tax=Desulforhopalus singaporensis TaxID=91360 RepID=A0A1H0TTF3_9BACT|nr:NADH-quinone oxidoreductase subunit J [Desulforhopalus singaporensis]SDP56836.1 NADH dehydrogenase subunit J [Desulforhopalus singaporensis]